MCTKGIIQSLVGTDKFVFEDAYLDAETNALVIQAQPTKHEQCRCGLCRRRAKYYDKGQGMRRWRAMDVGTQMAYVEAPVVRVKCKKHGVVTAAVPWARHDTWFCRSFEDTVTWLTVETSHTVVSELMRVAWHTVGRICKRVYDELEAAAANRFDGLVNIGIDETSYKKGHKYITVVVNHDTNAVVWCSKGFGKTTLKKFFERLTPEQRASIRCVSADGAKWIASCVEEYCPNAERCVDPFHVVSWATEVLGNERRKAWAQAHITAKAAQKRKPGRPAKGEVVNPEKEKAKALKDLRYVLLKNPENLSEAQEAQLTLLTEANPRLYRAYLLKEGLRVALKPGQDKIEEALKKWIAWAQRCRIPAFIELRAKIERHFTAIVASATHGLSNARIEATNNKIKLVIRRAYGFRNMDSMIAMVMLSCSSVHPSLPGR